MKQVSIYIMSIGLITLSVCLQPVMADDVREACTHDAFRLCNDLIPDEQRVRDCLAVHTKNLSPLCKTAFVTEKSETYHRDDRYHDGRTRYTHYRHRRHHKGK